MSAYSICIPRVFANITWKRVKAVFDQLGLGEIDRIDMVQRTTDDGAKFQRCFIHFKTWANNDNANAVRTQLDADGGEVKIVYDDPWFWKCFKSRVARPSQGPRNANQRAPTIELEGGRIIRAAQRAGARKVQGRRGKPQQKSQRGKAWTQRDPAAQHSGGGGGGGAAPASSAAADEFLANLSVEPTPSADGATAPQVASGPTTPPGSPDHPPAMSPTSTAALVE